MNKLREYISNSFGGNKKQVIDKVEQITDDAMIQFAEWHSNLMFDFNEQHDGKSTTELQKYFKENVYGK